MTSILISFLFLSSFFFLLLFFFFFFFFNDTAPPEISPLPLHDALPISHGARHALLGGVFQRRHRLVGLAVAQCLGSRPERFARRRRDPLGGGLRDRSEEHTSELQSLRHLVCRLLLEKKKKNKRQATIRI